jgi:formate hydrogenlyase subunit 4
MIIHGPVLQLLQFALVLALAPLFTGLVRFLKARLLSRVGPSPIQPYRDLAKLLRKEPVVAENASWLFHVAPYLVLAFHALAAGLVPVFVVNLPLAAVADLVVLVGLLAAARFTQALAGLDIGTSFGGLGASREMMIAALAESALLMIVFVLALAAHSTSIDAIATRILVEGMGVRISLALALIALIMVAIAETGRIPIDNPATHLELTMGHEAMILEYSGRHLALIELGAMARLLFFVNLIAALFVPFGLALADGPPVALAGGGAFYAVKFAGAALLLALGELAIAKMRLFRAPEFLGGALLLGLLGAVLLHVSQSL